MLAQTRRGSNNPVEAMIRRHRACILAMDQLQGWNQNELATGHALGKQRERCRSPSTRARSYDIGHDLVKQQARGEQSSPANQGFGMLLTSKRHQTGCSVSNQALPMQTPRDIQKCFAIAVPNKGDVLMNGGKWVCPVSLLPRRLGSKS